MSDSGELLARRIRAELGVLNDDSEPVDLLVRTVCARLAEVKAENSRLVVANKARDEFLRGHRHRGSAVDQYIDLCESHLAYWHRVADERNAEIVRLQARLAEETENAATYKQERDEIIVNYQALQARLAEAQEELAQWRATGESVTRNEHDLAARLAEVEARHQRVMAVIRSYCAKHTPSLLAEFDAATESTVSPAEGE